MSTQRSTAVKGRSSIPTYLQVHIGMLSISMFNATPALGEAIWAYNGVVLTAKQIVAASQTLSGLSHAFAC